ncbi:hypothetical protein M0R04_03835 [Candidatus Dojkabacteria bacterium]|jgi:hypothetical protein|nr:hypothetical protein [Candidatus Dojkabacteria bacterium]
MTAQIQKKNIDTNSLFYEDDVKFSILNSFLAWVKSFFLWWYVSMPVWYILSLKKILIILDDRFSVTLLFKNFFLPWHKKRDILGYILGVFMKIIFLPIGTSLLFFTSVIYTTYIIFWLLLPPITILGIFISPFVKII